MHVRVFTLRFSSATERFDDSSVVGFLADKEVLSIRDHFFFTDDVPYLTLVVCYRAAHHRRLSPLARPDRRGMSPGGRN